MKNTFREYLREAKNFLFLPDIIVNNKISIWNTEKTKEKILSQLNNRIKVAHITNSEKLKEILEKGLNKKYNEFAAGKGRENDTCIFFRRSLFAVLFNKDEHKIVSIRIPNDNLRYKGSAIIFEDKSTETYYDDALEKFCKDYLDIEDITLSEVIYEGIRFDLVEKDYRKVKASTVFKVYLEVDL